MHLFSLNFLCVILDRGKYLFSIVFRLWENSAAVPSIYPVDILIENHEILIVMSNGSIKKYIQLALGQYTK